MEASREERSKSRQAMRVLAAEWNMAGGDLPNWLAGRSAEFFI
jgi:hypothetical protein